MSKNLAVAETQTTTTTTAPKAGQKLTVLDIKLQNQKPGFEFTGKYVGTVLGSPFKEVDDKTGEIVEKQIPFVVFENKDGSRFKAARDKGLETAMADAMVQPGQTHKYVKLEKIKLKKGEMNQYDIYTA